MQINNQNENGWWKSSTKIAENVEIKSTFQQINVEENL